MSLFWTTDTGDIVTRFSQDFQIIDSTLPLAMMSVATSTCEQNNYSRRIDKIDLCDRSSRLSGSGRIDCIRVRMARHQLSANNTCCLAGATLLPPDIKTAPSFGS
jgi:hypothetical protein